MSNYAPAPVTMQDMFDQLEGLDTPARLTLIYNWVATKRVDQVEFTRLIGHIALLNDD